MLAASLLAASLLGPAAGIADQITSSTALLPRKTLSWSQFWESQEYQKMFVRFGRQKRIYSCQASPIHSDSTHGKKNMNSVVENYTNVLKNFSNFSARAGRQEFWMFAAANIAIGMVLAVVDGITGIPVLGILFGLATLVPGLAVSIRRLHDTDRSGWWLLVGFIPFLGALALLYFMICEGTRGNNQFGPAAVESGVSIATA